MNNIDRFKQFLRDNGVASEFYTSYYKYKLSNKPASVDGYLRTRLQHPSIFIIGAFAWLHDTKSNVNWASISNKWTDIVR